MTRIILQLTLALVLSASLNATILCPPDITISCTHSPTQLSVTGTPTVFNASGQLRYSDQRTHTQCNAGSIVRTWFLDLNGNGSLDSGEHSCIQNIEITYIPGTVTVNFPADREYECQETLQNENPTWDSTGPCDIIGISKQDLVFDADGPSCYKILRQWTVLNWCTYKPGGTEGIWTHTQIIKVSDKSVPKIQECKSITLGTDKGCEGTFSVSNKAIDVSLCGRQTLLWRAEVDLWADGSIDYNFSHNHPDTLYRLDTVGSNESVILTLPWPVRRGMHKVTWYVNDLCGNATSCTQTVFLRDDKKPTPYLHSLLSTSFDARQMDLMIPARIFNLGSFDNCSQSRHLRYSFSSNVNDTIKTIDCNTAGFNFFTIYITDLEGNQAQADVIVLAFDNGSCGNKASLKGQILESNGRPVTNAQFSMTVKGDLNDIVYASSNEDGAFLFENTALYKDNIVEPLLTQLPSKTVDIADLRLLQDYLTGITPLENFQFVASDLDGDNQIRSRDLLMLRDQLLYPQKFPNDNAWSYICDTKDISGPEVLSQLNNKVILKDADGPLHFRAVFIGDITDANESFPNPRTQNIWFKDYHNLTYAYLSRENLSLKGMQLEINLPPNTMSVSSPYFEVPSSMAHIDDNNVLRIVVAKDLQIRANAPILSITVDAESSESPLLSPASKILVNDYRTQAVIEFKADGLLGESRVAPNPAQDRFTVLNPKAKVLKIWSSTGSEVHFSQSDNEVTWDVVPGVYFIQLQVGNTIVTEKLLRH